MKMKYALNKKEWKDYQNLKHNYKEEKEKIRDRVIEDINYVLKWWFYTVLIVLGILAILSGALGYFLGAYGG